MNEAATSEATALRARAWKRFLRGPDQALVDELYVPALSTALRYDRCCAYFSSSVLAAAARGFGGLIARLIALGDAAPRPAVRLLVNEELAEEDVRALIESGDTSALESHLLKRLKTQTDKEDIRTILFMQYSAQAILTSDKPSRDIRGQVK